MGGVTTSVRPHVSPYAVFDRASWRALAADTRLPLDAAQLESLASLGDRIDLDEVTTVYLPLARLLQLHVEAGRRLWAARSEFLGNITAKVPYVIAVAGSVAAGKSTTSRLLQALLTAGPGNLRVDLVTTDGFLLPNAELQARGLLGRKGFPESYDRRALLRFLADVKSGRGQVTAPLYDHQSYDVVPAARQVVDRPDVLVLEGLNVLQAGRRADGCAPEVFLSDFFDFSVYVDAAESDLQRWYVECFLAPAWSCRRPPTTRCAEFCCGRSEARSRLLSLFLFFSRLWWMFVGDNGDRRHATGPVDAAEPGSSPARHRSACVS